VPGFGLLPPLGFHRVERGVLACGALGRRAAVICFELDPTARAEPGEDNFDGQPMSLEELEASVKRVLGADLPCGPCRRTRHSICVVSAASTRGLRRGYKTGRVILVGDAAHVHSPMAARASISVCKMR